MHVRRVSTGARAASILAVVLFGVAPAVSAQTADVQALRQEIEQLRKELEAVQQQYAERLSALEARLGATLTSYPASDGFEAVVDSNFDTWIAGYAADEHDLGHLTQWRYNVGEIFAAPAVSFELEG